MRQFTGPQSAAGTGVRLYAARLSGLVIIYRAFNVSVRRNWTVTEVVCWQPFVWAKKGDFAGVLFVDNCRAAKYGSPMKRTIAPYIELLKPVTWFPPMWAFFCGVVSSGIPDPDRWLLLPLGVLLAGPLVCGMSQIVNDWYDRHVDAINEPQRPIPSGRVPGRRALYFALFWSAVSLIVAWFLGEWVFYASILGVAMAWFYSMPPLRFKSNGWLGNLVVGLCYEGLPWFTGAAVMLGTLPSWQNITVLLLYSLGAHGIMTLNDFKALEGDRQMNVRSLPVLLGPERAAKFACLVMALPQVIVVGLLIWWGAPIQAGIVSVLLFCQLICMVVMLKDPKGKAPWYNLSGVTLYVLGMMVSASAMPGITAAFPSGFLG